MNKKLNLILSILTVAAMLLNIMPAALAVTTTGVLTPLSATITTFGEDVTVPEEGISVLTDDFFYSAYDAYNAFTDERDSKKRGAKLTDNTKKELVSFTSANSGIQWNFGDTPTIVKRIDLWILSYGGVGEYTVTAKNGSGDFEEIMSGDLTPVWEGQTTETSTAIHAIYYPIVLPSEIEATEVKLTFNTFTGGVENQAYISEARIYDTNEINLGAQGLFEASNENKGWSPYLERYAMSATMVGTTYNPSTTEFVHSGNNRVMWPSENKAVYIRESSPSNTLEGGKGRAWYATSLGMSKAKINRLTVNVNGGNTTGLKVYSRPSHDGSEYYRGIGTTAAIFPLDSGEWTQVASFSCNITKNSSQEDKTFEIPNAIESADILIEFEYATGSKAEIKSIDMYCVADSELTSFAKDAENVFDLLTTDTANPLEASEKIDGFENDAYIIGGKSYSVSWQYAQDFIDADGNITFHKETEKVTVTAVITDEETSIGYSVSKEFTLLPRENECTITASDSVLFEEGCDTELFVDGFVFSAYDKLVSGNINIEEHADKFATITSVNSSIEYSWLERIKLNRIDLWLHEAGSVEEYAVQKYVDGVWSDIKTGNLSDIASPQDGNDYSDRAVYYPITFTEEETNSLRFVIKSFGEGFSQAYISEASPAYGKKIELASAPENAEGKYKGYSHYMSGFVTADTSDKTPSYRKSREGVWPVYDDGSSIDVVPYGSKLWYATGFSSLPLNINRVTVNVKAGTANEIEILCAKSNASGFDVSNDYPTAPDELAQYRSVAVVRGTFNSSNPAVIYLPDAPVSGYWMIRVNNPSSNVVLDRVNFSYVYGDTVLETYQAAESFFENLPADFITNTSINFEPTCSYNGKNYNVAWECNSELIDMQTGAIGEHDRDENVIFTAIISDPDNDSVSFVVTKEFVLEGLVSVFAVSKSGDQEVKTKTTLLNDNFTYSSYDRSKLITSDIKNAYYNRDRFVWLDKVGSAIEYQWVNPKIIKRLELWAWPMDSVSSYEIQTSIDGVTWEKHYEGRIADRYADNPDSRPADVSDDAGTSEFYSIVFDEPTEPIKYIRFVATGFRDEAAGAYISEAIFGETNMVNYLGLGTISSDVTLDNVSKYVAGTFLSGATSGNTAHNRLKDGRIWPQTSAGTNYLLVPRVANEETSADVCWYATTMQGAPIAMNGAHISVSSGTVYEYEVMCAEGDSGYKWADYPTRPDLATKWRTVAHISGTFDKNSGIIPVNFNNDFKSEYWMIKITEATDDLKINGLGLYTFSDAELNKSGFVLDKVFDGVSDTSIDNVIKDKMNLPPTLTIDGEEYNVSWSYDSEIIDENGNVIPSFNNRVMTLKARIGKDDEGYRHVRTKDYHIISSDTRARTTIYNEEDIKLTNTATQVSSMELTHGFTFDGKTEIEIDFSADNTGGVINFTNGEDSVITLSVIDGRIVANEGHLSEVSVEYKEKLKLEIGESTYNLYYFNGAFYETLLYDKSLMKDKAPQSVSFTASAEKTLSIDSIMLKAVSIELFEAIEKQFDFEKISPNYRATNLNGDLTLFSQVGDVVFTYTSGNEEIINTSANPGKGIVNTDSYAETYITVNAVSDSAQDSFTKTFKVFVGKDNLFGEAVSSSSAMPVDSNISRFAADGAPETAFITNSKAYKINFDLQKAQNISRIRIIEADTTEKIQEFTVSVSSDNLNFTDVYTAAQINSEEVFPINYSEVRFVRITVSKTSGIGTGISEVCAYNEMTDAEKLSYDMSNSIGTINLQNGTIIPKQGKLGTSFTLASDNKVVTFSETDDKKGWIVSVGESSKEITVNITLTAENNAVKESKQYQIIVLQDTDIRDNEVPGGGNAGSSGGSSGSGGGGGSVTRPSDSVAVSGGSGAMSGSTSADELTGHWGSNEIKNLIMNGIVQGDGKSLQLDRSVTRAEFCKMIITGLGYELKSYSGIYGDTSQLDWFAPYAQTAKEYGIMTGSADGFRGNDVISRQEMAVVLINALKASLPEIISEKEISFSDSNVIASWAKSSVELAAGLGLLKGYDTGDFKPDSNLRRDESMVVVYRLLSYLGR